MLGIYADKGCSTSCFWLGPTEFYGLQVVLFTVENKRTHGLSAITFFFYYFITVIEKTHSPPIFVFLPPKVVQIVKCLFIDFIWKLIFLLVSHLRLGQNMNDPAEGWLNHFIVITLYQKQPSVSIQTQLLFPSMVVQDDGADFVPDPEVTLQKLFWLKYDQFFYFFSKTGDRTLVCHFYDGPNKKV